MPGQKGMQHPSVPADPLESSITPTGASYLAARGQRCGRGQSQQVTHAPTPSNSPRSHRYPHPAPRIFNWRQPHRSPLTQGGYAATEVGPEERSQRLGWDGGAERSPPRGPPAPQYPLSAPQASCTLAFSSPTPPAFVSQPVSPLMPTCP